MCLKRRRERRDIVNAVTHGSIPVSASWTFERSGARRVRVRSPTSCCNSASDARRRFNTSAPAGVIRYTARYAIAWVRNTEREHDSDNVWHG